MTVPSCLVAGDTWKWSRAEPDYPASDGWTLQYIFKSAAGEFTIDSVADGSLHSVVVDTATTAGYQAGSYTWQVSANKGGERYTLRSGTLKVEPDFTAAGALDNRSHARKVLDNIEAVIERRATRDQMSFSVEGRSLSRTPIADLIALRDRYRREVREEEGAARGAQGLGSRRKILTRFSN